MNRLFLLLFGMIGFGFVQPVAAQFDCNESYLEPGFHDYPIFEITASMLEVPNEFATISLALNAAQTGDTVWVHPGTYYEYNLDFTGKEIVLYGEGGNDACIIDAQGNSRIFDVTSGETYDTQIIGFTLQNGNHPTGSAIRIILNSALTVRHCAFLNNSAPGIWTRACVVIGQSQNNGPHTPAAVHFSDCLFEGNQGYYGASIFNESEGDWQTVVERCVFRENTAYTAPCMFGTRNSIIRNCLMYSNTATPNNWLIHNEGGHPLIQNCTFIDNEATVISNAHNNIYTEVSNCIFQGVEGVFILANETQFSFNHCSFEDEEYGTNPIQGPVELLSEACGFAPTLASAAVDGGDPEILDSDGSISDLGWIATSQNFGPGCTDPTACNYDAEATSDDSSCIPSGCMEPLACNFNALAECEGEACDYTCCPGPGCCADGTSWDYGLGQCVPDDANDPVDPTANSCPQDLDFDGVVGVGDLMDLLSVFGTNCPTNFTCGDPFTYHGYDYATVQIGEQCWFAENLRAEQYQNGDLIPGNLDDDAWTNTTDGAQAILNENEENLEMHGRLYNFYAVLDERGLCPAGWHVPADEEWITLGEELGGIEVAGAAMKNSGSDAPPWDGTNSSHWNGTPGGKREMAGWYGGNVGYWWTSTPFGCGGWHRNLHPNLDALTLSSYCNFVGFSVRCLKDQ